MKKDTFGTKIGKKLIEYCIINILVVFGNYARREMRVIFFTKIYAKYLQIKKLCLTLYRIKEIDPLTKQILRTLKILEIMKTLDAILKRNDYARLTATLKARVEEIAKSIREKMDYLDIADDDNFDNGEIGIDGVVVKVVSMKRRTFGEYEYLTIKREGECYGEEKWYSLEDVGKEYYYAGDFTAKVVGATNKEALAFLNVAKKLIKGLGYIEDERVKSVEAALNRD